MTRHRRRRLGVRRLVVAWSVVLITLALLAAGAVLRLQLREALERAIADETVTRADGVAALVETGDFGAVLEPSERTPVWVQVIDANGRVVASTPNVSSLTRPFAPTDARTRKVRRLSGLTIDDGEAVAVATVRTHTGGTAMTVLAASPLDLAALADARVVRSLIVVFAAILAVAAVTLWAATRRSLRPVAEIQAEVEVITAGDLSRRVPIPGGADEITDLAVTMNHMLSRLESSTLRQRRFVADASHELRSPLASLRNQLEVSAAESTDPRWRDRVEGMLIDHHRLERLVNDLLLLARHDEGTSLTLEPIDLGYLVRSELARRPVPPQQQRDVRSENALVNGDEAALARVLRNLVDNAERHAQHTVEVTVSADGDTVVLRVANDGDPIPPEARAAVFERFVRLDDARASQDGGSGLGLAIVDELVAEHGGTVSVISADDVNVADHARTQPVRTVFEVRLPRLPA